MEQPAEHPQQLSPTRVALIEKLTNCCDCFLKLSGFTDFLIFFLSGFSFMNVHDLQESRKREKRGWGGIYLIPF